MLGLNFIDAANTVCDDAENIIILVGKIVSIFQIVIPILLVVLGLVSLGKAVVASKEDEVKKATSGLVKKIILAVAIFFIVTLVKMIVSLVGGDDMKHCWEVINNPWDSTKWTNSGRNCRSGEVYDSVREECIPQK